MNLFTVKFWGFSPGFYCRLSSFAKNGMAFKSCVLEDRQRGLIVVRGQLYVKNSKEVLSFSRDDSLYFYFWFEQGGPLVIRNHGASLSLFLRNNQHPGHTVAFAVEAAAFLSLVPALNAKGIPFTVCDHDVSMSVYFNDLSDNKIELTSYEYLQAKQLLESVV